MTPREPRSCPACRCHDVRRSKRRSLYDNLANLVRVKPFRCEVCRTRFHSRQTDIEVLDSLQCASSPIPLKASSRYRKCLPRSPVPKKSRSA